MALLASEIARIKYELGYNLLRAGAEPYISVYQVFEQIIQTYLGAGATTTSSTTVAAPTVPGTLTTGAITLASATGFATGDRIVVDIDDLQETSTIQLLAGAIATVRLMYGHSGTYPVSVEGGESIVREILQKLRTAAIRLGAASVLSTAGLKRAEDIEWYGNGTGLSSQIVSLRSQVDYYRDELASALGVVNLREWRKGASLSSVLY